MQKMYRCADYLISIPYFRAVENVRPYVVGVKYKYLRTITAKILRCAQNDNTLILW